MNNLKQLKIGKANVCTTIFLEISLYVVYGFNSVETRLYFDGKEKLILVIFLVNSHLGLLKWMKSEYLGMYSTTGALAVTIHLLDRPQSK